MNHKGLIADNSNFFSQEGQNLYKESLLLVPTYIEEKKEKSVRKSSNKSNILIEDKLSLMESYDINDDISHIIKPFPLDDESFKINDVPVTTKTDTIQSDAVCRELNIFDNHLRSARKAMEPDLSITHNFCLSVSVDQPTSLPLATKASSGSLDTINIKEQIEDSNIDNKDMVNLMKRLKFPLIQKLTPSKKSMERRTTDLKNNPDVIQIANKLFEFNTMCSEKFKNIPKSIIKKIRKICSKPRSYGLCENVCQAIFIDLNDFLHCKKRKDWIETIISMSIDYESSIILEKAIDLLIEKYQKHIKENKVRNASIYLEAFIEIKKKLERINSLRKPYISLK